MPIPNVSALIALLFPVFAYAEPAVQVCATNGGPMGGCLTTAPKFEHRWGGLVHDVFSGTADVAWTVEDGGRIRQTTNGDFSSSTGAWSFQPTPDAVHEQLRRVAFLSNNLTGWAVGDGGWVLKTTNGGTAWNCQWREKDASQPLEKATLFDVFFKDANNGWLLGLHQLKSSSDGGATWTNAPLFNGSTQLDPCALELYAMDFLVSGNQFFGLAVAEPGLILMTSDTSPGGAWSVVFDAYDAAGNFLLQPPCPPPWNTLDFEPWDVSFVSGTSIANPEAIVVGGIGHPCGYILVADTNANPPLATWVQEYPECPTSPCSTNQSQCFPNQVQLTGLGTQYGVSTFADRSATSGGYGGRILRRDVTVDPPVWRDRSDAVGAVVNKVSIPLLGSDGLGAGLGTGTAWQVGFFNAISKSTDGGHCYSLQTQVEPYRLQDVWCRPSNVNVGWQVAQGSLIAKTLNGGRSWAPAPGHSFTPGGPKLFAITFDPNMTNGVAVGTGGKICFTSSQGNSWTTVNPVSTNLHEVAWSAGTEFWTGGPNDTVLHLTNGGANWTNVPTNVAGFNLQGIAFADASTGFACGHVGLGGKLFSYASGTGQWNDVTPSTLNLRVLMDVAAQGSVAYASGLKIDALGNKVGVILERQTNGTFQEVVLPGIDVSYCARENGDLDEGFTHTYNSDPAGENGTILNDVEIVPGTGGQYEVYVGGDCGKMLHRTTDGTWEELKSQTSFHIYGMSIPSAAGGFVTASARGDAVVLAKLP